MKSDDMIQIVIAYAETAEIQHYFSLHILKNTDVNTVLSNLEVQQKTGLTGLLNNAVCGVFGQKVTHDYLLKEGDRLEIYRPLTYDPMNKRRLKEALKRKRLASKES